MKIHLFGASGSGVTTLGKALAERLSIPYFDADDYFWESSAPSFTIKRDREKRNRSIRLDLDKHDSWILGGSVVNWGEDAFPVFDLIVFLWIPAEVRLDRLRAREEERYGSLIHTDPVRKKLYEDFMTWAAGYDDPAGIVSRNLITHEGWLGQQKGMILELRGNLAVIDRIYMIINKLKEIKAI